MYHCFVTFAANFFLFCGGSGRVETKARDTEDGDGYCGGVR